MIIHKYLPCTTLFIFTFAINTMGYTNVPVLDLLKIAGAACSYLYFKKKEKSYLAPKELTSFLTRVHYNALTMSLECIDFKPAIKAFSVCIHVPESYQELFADVFQIIINATNGATIDNLTDKRDYYRMHFICKNTVIHTAETLIGRGIKYGIKAYIYESDYMAEFLSGFTIRILMSSIGCEKSMTQEEQEKEIDGIQRTIFYKGYLNGLKGCASKLVSTYLPQEGIFTVKVLEKTIGDNASAYILKLATQASNSVKMVANF